MTAIFVIGILVVILAYDVYAYLTGGIPKTISSLIYNTSYSKPAGALIPFAAGALMYHLFIGN